jgi:hypothetical protein
LLIISRCRISRELDIYLRTNEYPTLCPLSLCPQLKKLHKCTTNSHLWVRNSSIFLDSLKFTRHSGKCTHKFSTSLINLIVIAVHFLKVPFGAQM